MFSDDSARVGTYDPFYGYGTVGTVGTVRWVRWVRCGRYDGYGTVGTVGTVRCFSESVVDMHRFGINLSI